MRRTRTAATLVAVVRVCAIAAYGGVAGAQQNQTEPVQLTRQQAIADALAHNAQLEVAREQTAQARARRQIGIAVPDPTLTAAYDQLSSPFSFGGAPSRPVSVGLDIPFPNKFRLNSRIGLADIAANQSNFRLQQQTVVIQASATYDSLLVALMHRDNLREARTLANDFLTRTQARFNAGTAARLDVIQAQVAVAQADNDLIGNERDIAVARASLTRVLGRVGGAAIVPTDTLGIPASLPDSSTIERDALANRPELSIVDNQRQGAHANTSLAREFWFPDLTFAVAKDYAAPGSPLFTTGITMPIPLLYWQHSQGDVALAQHAERELDATYRDTRAQVTQDVRSAYANASTAMRQVVFLRDQLLPAAREAYRVASTSYGLGGSSALEVLAARTSLLQAQSQFADALAAANTARADLDRALGINVPPGASNR